MDRTFREEVLGRYCRIIIKQTEQAALLEKVPIKTAVYVEGLIVKISKNYIYLSDGTDDSIEKIIPKDSIGYIDLDPDLEEQSISGYLEAGKPDEEDDGQRH